jgi:hypothetical protein
VAYIHCDSCGAKALAGATRCPRCQKGFVEYDAKGNRISTVRCASCGVLRPQAIGACPNCNAGAQDSAARSARSLMVVGIGIAVVIAGGYGISKLVSSSKPTVAESTVPIPPKDSALAVAPVKRDTLTTAEYLDSVMNAAPPSATTTTAPAVKAPPTIAPAVVVPAAAPPSTAVPPTNPAATAPRAAPIATPDTGRWEYYAATTWVRVRSGPGREYEMTRMIDSSQRVRLGPSNGGWREVRVGKDHGWVDPRLFAPAAAPKP